MSLISARMELDNPKVDATAVKASSHVKSSVEVKNSCNCFKICCPCFKSKEKDSQKLQQKKTEEIAHKAFFPPREDSTPGRLVRSPSYDSLPAIKSEDMTEFKPMPIVQNTSITNNVAINISNLHSSGTTPQASASVSYSSTDSSSGD